ncbi:MAG TPA: ATP-dependent helicase/nuclease subunit A [Cytophagales bacterium]|nr:ATP-dependent helicase/nuclease subunit A [Cytophagales bacterium]HAP63075.1 ATP-dependent helicase/nuclease subunit A [Cytophagales bacterium]
MSHDAAVLEIFRSSAGSGKTYTLTQKYLILALTNPDYFRYILAVTFTNKATQEMKGRIVETLDLLRQDSHKVQTMRDVLAEELQVTPKEIAKRASEVLSSILHQYGHFSVSTIDSFFQKIIRSFSREIGLQGGFTVELDTSKVLGELVDKLMERIGEEDQPLLTRWLVDFSREQLEEGAVWDIRRELELLGSEIFQEAYKQEHTGRVPPSLEELKTFQKKLKGVKAAFENSLKNFGKQAALVLDTYHLTVDSFKWKNAGAVGWLLKQQQQVRKSGSKWTFEPSKRAREGAVDSLQLLNKKSTGQEESAAEELMVVLGKAISYIDASVEEYLTALAVLRHFYSYGILSYLAQLVIEYRDENEVMLISDANDFLQQIIAEHDTPFVYEKVGAFYRHYLVDEFQDTSSFQWHNLRPLIENSLDQNHRNLVVGDVKQSIYRWRGGDWSLLLEKIQQDIGHGRTAEAALQTNWRSLPEVIEFNNALFSEAPQLLLEDFQYGVLNTIGEEKGKAILQEAHKVPLAYADAQQSVRPHAGDLSGRIEVSFVREGEEETDPCLQKVPGWLEELQDAGYALRDIAFLVRTKKEGQQIVDVLMKYQADHPASSYSYDVISSEALALDSAPAVRLLLYGLQALHQPENSLAQVQLAYELAYYGLQKTSDDALHAVFAQPKRGTEEVYEGIPRGFEEQRNWLARLPLYECVETLISLLEVNRLAGQFAYLQAFQDAVLEYCRMEQTDLGGFLKWWETTGYKRSVQVPEQMNAARIYTIHKSKGLQFKAVLMPFVHWSLDHRSTQANFLWTKETTTTWPYPGAVPVRYSQGLAETAFWSTYLQERLWAQLDNLNLLYVAFTRAEEVLKVASKHPDPKGKGNVGFKDVGALLWQWVSRFSESNGQWDESLEQFTYGKPLKTALAAPENTDQSGWDNYPAAQWQHHLSIRNHAEDFFHLQEDGKAAVVEYGTLAHRLLALIHTADQVAEAAAALQREGVLSAKDQMHDVVAMVQRVLQLPEVSDWFSGKWTVKTEVPILPKTGEVKRLDRVMIDGDRVIVVDFKTGTVQAETSQSHRKQVGYYAKLLREMGYATVEGYLMYLQMDKPIRVI